MGIDYDSRIIFGMLLSYEEFVTVLKSFMMTEEEENEDYQNFYYEKIDYGDRFHEKYPGLILGTSSPYFDCDFDQKIFYVCLHDSDEIDIETASRLISSHESSSFKKFCEHYNLEYEPPRFISIINVT
jgi:hypothetical protein